MEYKVIRLDGRRFRIYDPLGVFVDLIAGDERALLIDTGYGMGDLKAVVKELTDLPLYIVNTHGHVDHSCGNYQFKEPVYIHPADMGLCVRHNARLQRAIAVEYARSMDEIRVMLSQEEFDAEAYLGKSTGKLIPVTEGQVFDLGGVHLKIIELPGHTLGSIGVLYEEKRVLYVGDAANDFLWLFLPEAGDLTMYRNTLEKIADLDCSKLILSHKPGEIDTSVLQDYKAAVDEINYEKGIAFSAPLVPGATARICCRRGYSIQDEGRPGFASIAINKDHF